MAEGNFPRDGWISPAEGCFLLRLLDEARAASGWRPIWTAPKDGTKFDAWQNGERQTDVYWSDIQEDWCVDGSYGPEEPTLLAIIPPGHALDAAAHAAAGGAEMNAIGKFFVEAMRSTYGPFWWLLLPFGVAAFVLIPEAIRFLWGPLP